MFRTITVILLFAKPSLIPFNHPPLPPPPLFFFLPSAPKHTTQQATTALLATLQTLAEGPETQALEDAVQTQRPKQAVDNAAQSQTAQLDADR